MRRSAPGDFLTRDDFGLDDLTRKLKDKIIRKSSEKELIASIVSSSKRKLRNDLVIQSGGRILGSLLFLPIEHITFMFTGARSFLKIVNR